MTEVWRQASQDLGFAFVAPFTLKDGQETLAYLGLVPQFGSPKGMLIIVGLDAERHGRVAIQHGYGYSCFSDHSDAYNREDFVDILSDWGWSGSPESAPSWISERSRMASELDSKFEAVCDEESFIAFIFALAMDRADEVAKEKLHPSSPYGPGANGWENGTIEDFLHAAARWADASKNGLRYYEKPSNLWKRCAQIIYMGKSYE